jgi:hypothetical protein
LALGGSDAGWHSSWFPAFTLSAFQAAGWVQETRALGPGPENKKAESGENRIPP